MRLFDKDSNLVNVANSLLKAYKAPTLNESYAPLDALLARRDLSKTKICLMLFDGFGTAIQSRHRFDAPFIYNHRTFRITSVFPPTTVAATTSLLTGLYPIQSGWLGWTQIFPGYENPVVMFPSVFDPDGSKAPFSTWDRLHNEDILSMIGKTGHRAESVMGFELNPKTSANFFAQTEMALAGNDFIYAYWPEPDMSLHINGTRSKAVGDIVRDLDIRLKSFAERHKDVMFIVLADHGHTDVTYASIYKHKDMLSLLRNSRFGLEPRAGAFYVRPDKKKEFRELAVKYYGHDFYILSSRQVINQHVFGYGKENPLFRAFIGDFLFIAKKHAILAQDTTHDGFKAHHGGSTPAERYINIAVIN